MIARRTWRKVVAASLSLALFVLLALPAYAADNGAAAGASLDIRLKLGGTQMTVNGSPVTVQAPFQKNGVTYVPLSILTKGLGVGVQLQNNKIITLKAGGHTVVLTVGSKTETVDGKNVTLAGAPVVLNGYTMVPVRVIEAFGAKVTYTASTKEIKIAAQAFSSETGGTGGIDTDAGKNLIGDSFFKWSMNYPTGLVQTYQSRDGDQLTFEDVKQDFFLEIDTVKAEDPMDANDQLSALQDYMDGETVIDKKPVTRDGGTFQRIVSKTKDGYYYDYRGIQANGYFYVLIFGKKAISATDLAKSSGKMLDSFQPKFDAGNASLKDLTKIVDGLVSFDDKDYGLSLSLPYGWVEDDYGYDSGLYFYNDTSDLSLDVYSLQPNDTLDALTARYVQAFKDTFVEAGRKEPKTTDIVWNGVPAKWIAYSYMNEDKDWVDENVILAVNGHYKFQVTLSNYEGNPDEDAAVVKLLQERLKLDFSKVESTFGEIPDSADTLDRTAVTAKTSSKYGYSIAVPKSWTLEDGDMNSDYVSFSSNGLVFIVGIDTSTKIDAYLDQVVKSYDNAGAKLISKTPVTVGGAQGYQLVFQEPGAADSMPGIAKFNLLSANNKVYYIGGALVGPNATDFNKKQFEDALASFTITKS